LRILFVSYLRAVNDQQIGVLKRCLRLVAALDSRHEFFVLNFGPLFEDDPLQRSLASRITFRKEPQLSELESFLRDIAPQAVVMGECPVRGSLYKVYRAAAALGIPQFAIENYYGRVPSRLIQLKHYHIRRWLMLGEPPRSIAATWGREVVPPLIPPMAAQGLPGREGITVIGYEDDSLAMAWRILERLQVAQQVRVFAPEKRITQLPARHSYIVRSNPTDDELFSAMAQSKLVIAKGGFQQISESVWLGTPVVAKKKYGGAHALLLPPSYRPQVRLIDDERAELQAMPWISERLNCTKNSQNNSGRPGSLHIAAARLEAMLNGC
jgi:hypothetical protein